VHPSADRVAGFWYVLLSLEPHESLRFLPCHVTTTPPAPVSFSTVIVSPYGSHLPRRRPHRSPSRIHTDCRDASPVAHQRDARVRHPKPRPRWHRASVSTTPQPSLHIQSTREQPEQESGAGAWRGTCGWDMDFRPGRAAQRGKQEGRGTEGFSWRAHFEQHSCLPGSSIFTANCGPFMKRQVCQRVCHPIELSQPRTGGFRRELKRTLRRDALR
jgi:hypothetical protein